MKHYLRHTNIIIVVSVTSNTNDDSYHMIVCFLFPGALEVVSLEGAKGVPRTGNRKSPVV